MPKFNNVNKNTTKAVSYEGGAVYEKSLEDAWSNMLFSCMLAPGYYEDSNEIQTRYTDLTKKMIEKRGPLFVAKAASFSRNMLGLRSISELTAAILNGYQFEGKRQFYAKYFRRPDGIGEVFAAIESLQGKRSHALIRGAADYLSGLNAYQIGKYTMSHRDFNMHDIINLTHAYSEVLDKYQKGELESPDTWEVKISTAKSDEERANEWRKLAEGKKLGYLALIRNLRNICDNYFADEDWCKEVLYDQIVNEEAIKKSLVFPYQIYVAWKNSKDVIPIILELALSEAFKLSVSNMPDLKGTSCIILDVSGSMSCQFTENSSLQVNEVCSVYAAAIYWKNKENTSIVKFGTYAKVIDYAEKHKNVFKLIEALTDNDGVEHGTRISSAFEKLDKHYDRIFLFSDMQIMESNSWWWDNGKPANELYEAYLEKYGMCTLYSFDLGNCNTQVVSQNRNVKYITALNDKVFKAIELEETDGKSLIDFVEGYAI